MKWNSAAHSRLPGAGGDYHKLPHTVPPPSSISYTLLSYAKVGLLFRAKVIPFLCALWSCVCYCTEGCNTASISLKFIPDPIKIESLFCQQFNPVSPSHFIGRWNLLSLWFYAACIFTGLCFMHEASSLCWENVTFWPIIQWHNYTNQLFFQVIYGAAYSMVLAFDILWCFISGFGFLFRQKKLV